MPCGSRGGYFQKSGSSGLSPCVQRHHSNAACRRRGGATVAQPSAPRWRQPMMTFTLRGAVELRAQNESPGRAWKWPLGRIGGYM
jgi:hypothetical protein